MGYLSKGGESDHKTSFSTPDTWGPDWSAIPAWLWFLLAAAATVAAISLL